jgi:arylsulfatase
MKDLKLLGCMAAVPALATLPTQAEAASKSTKADKRPNVIFIMMDDAGHGDFGCYGQTKTETPYIDSLASEGILFTNMYSAAPLSAPSRCCLLTGVHSGHAQIRNNREVQNDNPRIWNYEDVNLDPGLEGQFPLRAGTVTLGTAMQQAGYTTAMVGKWGVGGPATESLPWTMGFDFYYGCLCQRLAHEYYPDHLWRNDQKEILNPNSVKPGTPLDKDADPKNIRSYDKYKANGVYGPDKMFENVINFVDENAQKPFFLMWTTPLPHSPLQAPQEFVDYYVKKFGDEKPLAGDDFHVDVWPHNYYPCRYPHATYAAMISYFDYQVGQLVAELKRLGIYENTIIIFTSDNGPANNASSPTVWFDSAQPFRCGKGWGKSSLHEGGIRMPFIASWPAKMKKGSVSDHIGNFTDIMPTICDVAGVKAPQNDGVSIFPILEGKTKKQQEHPYLYWEYPAAGGQLAVRIGNWKGLVRNIFKGNHTMELYDISVPSKEVEAIANNVAHLHPDIVEQMWQIIEQSHEDIDVPGFQVSVSRQ